MNQPQPTEGDIIRVLHVDDEESQLKFTKLFLERIDRGLKISSIRSAEEALPRLGEEQYDCVISDYKMTGMNGIEFSGKLKEFTDIPVIIYTGQGSEKVAEAAFSVGIGDYLKKEVDPSHFQVLARRVRMAVEKYRAEKALLESEERYRTLVEGSPDAISVTIDSELVYVNQKRVELTGHTDKESLIGTRGIDSVTSMDRGKVEARIEARSEGESPPIEMSYRMVTRDGSIICVKEHSTSIIWQGKPAVLHILHDVTDKKRMEEELHQSQELFIGFKDSAPFILHLYDSDLNLISFNRKAAEETNMSMEELGKPMLEVAPSLAGTARYEQYKRVVETGDPYFTEVVKHSKRTGERYLSITAFKVNKGLGLIIDNITERKKVEREAREREEQYRRLFDQSNDSVFLHTPNGTILDVNKMACDLFGYGKEELLKTNMKQLLPKEALNKASEEFEAMLEKGSSRFESKFKRVGGRILDVDVSASIVNAEKNVIQAIARDITEMKSFRERLPTLHTCSIKLNLVNDIEDILETTLQTIERIFEFDFAGISTLEGDEIRYIWHR